MTANGQHEPMEKRTGRKPMEYTDTIGNEVCRLVAEGSNLFRIGNDPENGLPGKTTL